MFKQTSSIDWELCLELSNNEPDIAKELLTMLIEILPEDKKAIAYLYEKQDYPELERRVHKLHGALCYTGVPYLKSATKELEQLLKDKSYYQLEHVYQIFSEELEKVLKEFSKEFSEL